MNPDAFEEAKALLEEAEKALAKGGKPLKYSDKELAVMLENPAIKDKYIVRFMQADYLHAKASDGTLIEFGGQLGQVDPTTGTVKYWSTTFDQIVQNDHDADLIRRSVGMGMNYFKPDKEYVLLLIDRAKHEATGAGTTIVPTYENLGDFA
ncbi:MAG: hypothetical protein P8X74_24195, partial [Reinekea sp.]